MKKERVGRDKEEREEGEERKDEDKNNNEDEDNGKKDEKKSHLQDFSISTFWGQWCNWVVTHKERKGEYWEARQVRGIMGVRRMRRKKKKRKEEGSQRRKSPSRFTSKPAVSLGSKKKSLDIFPKSFISSSPSPFFPMLFRLSFKSTFEDRPSSSSINVVYLFEWVNSINENERQR